MNDPHRRKLLGWRPEWWPGARQAVGFAVIAVEFTGQVFLGRELDKEVIPFALAMIVWEPQRRRQERRNARRENGD